MAPVLLIFIKNPRLGAVKTRLARTVGNAEALRIYRFLLEKTRQAAHETAAARWLFYSDALEENDGWPAADFCKFVQTGDDLGARMANAFQRAFEAGAHRALIIGSDCPALSGPLLEEAFDRLNATDFVLGPTPDGGYYLLGMQAPEPSIFQGIDWSTETVREKTLEKIRAAGKTISLLPELADIDTEDDWRRYLQSSHPSL
ncbi:MAG: TIGR04282 family arsenosugar biosynthesis glycosyltransferase [Saprospirales bacterium]|nr:TIGR04282 family arsenosugar biosynthesis glycosyltransferase [Saprospirales bacterium]MBK8921614.1 TIGR04282 family arsenosugar biosynthesis glycosyltransferase [Saprospirales bacterium]